MVDKAAIAVDPRETSVCRSAIGQPIDRLGQLHVPLGYPAGVVAGQAEVDSVPDARELGMVVDLLGMERHARQEGECFAEVAKPERANQRLVAVLTRPSVGSIHCRFSCPTSRRLAYGPQTRGGMPPVSRIRHFRQPPRVNIWGVGFVTFR